MRKLRLGLSGSDDPLEGMANLFDLGVVFALGFGIAVLARVAVTSPQTVTNLPRERASDPVPAQTNPLEHYRSTNESLGGNGTRLGTAYRLANGDVVYVPDGAAPPAAAGSETHD